MHSSRREELKKMATIAEEAVISSLHNLGSEGRRGFIEESLAENERTDFSIDFQRSISPNSGTAEFSALIEPEDNQISPHFLEFEASLEYVETEGYSHGVKISIGADYIDSDYSREFENYIMDELGRKADAVIRRSEKGSGVHPAYTVEGLFEEEL